MLMLDVGVGAALLRLDDLPPVTAPAAATPALLSLPPPMLLLLLLLLTLLPRCVDGKPPSRLSMSFNSSLPVNQIKRKIP